MRNLDKQCSNLMSSRHKTRDISHTTKRERKKVQKINISPHRPRTKLWNKIKISLILLSQLMQIGKLKSHYHNDGSAVTKAKWFMRKWTWLIERLSQDNEPTFCYLQNHLCLFYVTFRAHISGKRPVIVTLNEWSMFNSHELIDKSNNSKIIFTAGFLS